MKLTVKKIMALIFAGLVLFAAAPLNANAVTENDFIYYVSNGQAALISSLVYPFKGNLIIPDTLGGFPVTRIEDGAFPEYDEEIEGDELTGVSIPDSVTSIGDDAFERDTLEGIYVDMGNPAYASENGVLFNKSKTELIRYPKAKAGSSYTIPNSVTSIGGGAFSECYDLKTITIPDSVTNIEAWAFADCDYLKSVIIPNSVTSIDDGAFANCYDLDTITIPDSITSIGAGAFDNTSWYDGHKGLIYIGKLVYGYNQQTPAETAIVIKPGTIGIAEGAFAGCEGVESITVPASVTNIADGAFSSCYAKKVFINEKNPAYTVEDGVLFNKSKTELIQYIAGRTGSSYTIPDSVTSIGDEAFFGCDGLKSIMIPASVKSIGNGAFSACGLTNITIPGSVKSIGDRAFSNCSGLKSITISNGVESIGDEAFYICAGLKSITIPGSVKSIGDEAFYWCYELTSITIQNGVERIGSMAFNDCDKLKSVTIPDSVTSIGQWAFYETAWYNNQPKGLIYMGKVAYFYKGLPTNEVIVLKPGTKGIAGGAFQPDFGYGSINNPGLLSIGIPNTVTNIGDRAFFGCSLLKSVTIPKSVVSIGDQAFGYDNKDYSEVPLSGFIINCYADSEGQRYATENGIQYKILPASYVITDPDSQADSGSIGNKTITVIIAASAVFIAAAGAVVIFTVKKKKK